MRPRAVTRYDRPAFERADRQARDLAFGGAGGIVRMNAGLIAGRRARRSTVPSSGIRAYIMTMPETNQTTNSTPLTMPSQRCV